MKRYSLVMMLVTIMSISVLTVQFVNAAGASTVDSQKFVVTIDDHPVDFTFIGSPMLLTNGRVFMPERFMSKYLAYNGHNPEYTEEIASQNVWLNDEKTTVEMTLNQSTALVNGKKVYIDYTPGGKPVVDSKPYVYKERVYVPLRFICETFGEAIDYKKVGDLHHIAIITNVEKRGTVSTQNDFGETEFLAGYMTIKNNTVYFNEVEIVQWDDQERVKELGLNDHDMPSGYLIISKNKETSTFELADQAKYTFTDTNHLFVKKYTGNVLYTTSELDEFLEHLGVHNLNDIPLSEQTIPYFTEVQDGKVISITEKFEYTV